MPFPFELSSRVKQRLRRAADRVVLPYVEQIRHTYVDAGPAGAESQPADDGASVSLTFHMTNHTLRELELGRLRADWKRVLSVGANGSWYFEWFRQAVGDVAEHIGLEAYLPEPDDLPDYVTWIPNSAHQMDDVDSASVDLVFAGQTSEHMWPDELAGFLAEAHRVLRPGGTLALDSPNRLVTQHLHWSHGEHTIELDHEEMTHLLALAGFDATTVSGMWRCAFDGRVWQLEEGIDVPEQLTKRIALGREHPEDSFCWWINAERTDRSVDRSAIGAAANKLFTKHWNTRVSRGLFPAVGADLPLAPGVHDPAAQTLPFPLRAGTWRVTLNLAGGTWTSVDDLQVEVIAPGDHLVHVGRLADADRGDASLSWTFEQPHLLFALVVRVRLTTRAPITIAFPLEISPV